MNLEEKKEMEKLFSKKASKMTAPFVYAKGVVMETQEGIRLYPIVESMDYYLFNPEDIQIETSKETTFYEGKEVPVQYVSIKIGSISCRVVHSKIVVNADRIIREPSGEILRLAAHGGACDADWGWGAWFD